MEDEIEIFSGSENRLTMRQTYTKTFQCQYQLHHYPFDTQVCYMLIVVSDLHMKNINLRPDVIELRENKELTMYIISRWQLAYNVEEDPKSGVKMMIVLKRRIQNEFLTTYVPSILLTLITFATMHFKPFYFEAALTVNLTTMLVMTTIFISVMDRLPATAYIKHIDIWLLGCQLLPFVEVIILTMKEKLRKGNELSSTEDEMEQKDTRTINNHGHPRIVQEMPRTAEEGPVPTEDDKIVVIGEEEISPVEEIKRTDNPINTVADESNPWIHRLTIIGEFLNPPT